MISLLDQTGYLLRVGEPPKKIVSLVPSLSETIADCAGLEILAGVTKFCVHPTGLRHSCAVIGGTKNPQVERIRSLSPDLVLANKEENRQEDIEAIRQFCPVYVTDIKNLSDVTVWLRDMQTLIPGGQFLPLTTQIIQMTGTEYPPVIRAAYLIWQNPYMTVGGDTFIHAMMQHFGFDNVFGDKTRYPVTDTDELLGRCPDVILLSSEPFPFRKKHVDAIQQLMPSAGVHLVNGEYFSWYGSRLKQAMKGIPSWKKT